VYFISRSSKVARVHYDRMGGDFKLAWISPCHAVTSFHRTMLRPYSASAEAIERGYADIAECRPMAEIDGRVKQDNRPVSVRKTKIALKL
jgi:hypothetical protein